MALGDEAGVHAMMPYWLITVLSVIKPLMTILLLGHPTGALPNAKQDGFQTVLVDAEENGQILLLGPPAGTLPNAEQDVSQTALVDAEESAQQEDAEQGAAQEQDSLCSSEEDSQQDGSMQEEASQSLGVLAILKREAAGSFFLLMAILGTLSLGYKIFQVVADAGATVDAAREIVLLLANAPGVVSMVNIVALIGLYRKREGNSVDQALLGIGSTFAKKLNQFVGQRGEDNAAVAVTKDCVAFLMMVLFGSFFGSLDREAVGRIPATSQRSLAYALWAVYKPLWEVVRLAALPALTAYFWMWLPAFFVVAFLAWVLTLLALECLLGRSWAKTPPGLLPSQPPRESSVNLLLKWFSYFFVSAFFGLILPIFVPLSLRLVAGDGYWGSVSETCNDRHAPEYSMSLLASVEMSLESVLRRADSLLTLIQSTL